jgi:hypothetical protein
LSGKIFLFLLETKSDKPLAEPISRSKRLFFCLLRKSTACGLIDKTVCGFYWQLSAKTFLLPPTLATVTFFGTLLLIRPASVKWATAKIFCALLTIYKSRTPQTRVGRTPPLASAEDKGV